MSNSRLYYIGHTSFVIGGKLQRQLLSKDGLHLSRSGVATVVRDLEGEIQYILRRRTLRSLRTIEHPTPYLDALKSSTKPTTTQPTTEATKPVPDQPNDFPPLPTREGTGWWKHEFCFNKHARQFHDDNNGRIAINLGYWNEEKHFEWVEKNPSKIPRPKGSRKQLSLLYTGGDKCDITGKDRIVEVKLKCVEKKNQPHSVSIYLMEPKTCEYILGIESPLLCSVLDKADDHGIIRDLKV